MEHAWLIVTSQENFETTQSLGFTVQGVKARHKKKAQAIQAGDGLLYYMTKRQVFCATATITSSIYEDGKLLWRCQSNPETEVYPIRFGIQLDMCLDPTQYVDVKPWVDHISYLQKWPAKNWTLGFQGNLHQWPIADYTLMRSILLKAQKNKG